MYAVISRVIAAFIGAYLLANLGAIALSYVLPVSQASGVMIATQLSFLIYAAAVLWIFSAKTCWRAWLRVLVPSAACAAVIFLFMPRPWL